MNHLTNASNSWDQKKSEQQQTKIFDKEMKSLQQLHENDTYLNITKEPITMKIYKQINKKSINCDTNGI